VTAKRSLDRRLVVAIALGALFGFRLLFGLSQQLFTEDETQIYLLGLRFFASGHWPYFGPDVVWTKSQIPGALQPLLVGLPFFIVRVPEAPYLLLNALSMGGLLTFALYLSARLPELPRWLLWGWLFTLPWTLELSTHIINPSYVLPASAIFFVAPHRPCPRAAGPCIDGSGPRLDHAAAHVVAAPRAVYRARVLRSRP
jgi:hypothetical protein